MEVIQVAVLKDNYNFIAHHNGQTAVIDPSLSEPIIAILQQRGWSLDFIFNTHHHWDHTDGNLALKEKYNCAIYASEYDKNRIPGIDHCLNENDTVSLGGTTAKVISLPGHTLGHIAYHFSEFDKIFLGDTLFSLGCGRLFEGSPEQMWNSLGRLKALPDSTTAYCAHEYSAANCEFAIQFEKDNVALSEREKEIFRLRSQNQPTVPLNMGQEKATNPFLRADQQSLKQALKMPEASDVETFAELRRRKDSF